MAPLDIKEIPPHSTLHIKSSSIWQLAKTQNNKVRGQETFSAICSEANALIHTGHIFVVEFYLPFQENQGCKLEKTGRCDSPRSFAALRNKIAVFCRLATFSFSSVISIVITIILMCTKTWVTADSVSHFLFLEDRLHERELLQMPITLSSTKCTMCLC